MGMLLKNLGIPFGNGYHLVTLTKAEFLVVWKVRFILYVDGE